MDNVGSTRLYYFPTIRGKGVCGEGCAALLSLAVAPHLAHLEWQPIELAVYGYRLADTQETAALRALTTFCARHPDLVEAAPIGLFPPA